MYKLNYKYGSGGGVHFKLSPFIRAGGDFPTHYFRKTLEWPSSQEKLDLSRPLIDGILQEYFNEQRTRILNRDPSHMRRVPVSESEQATEVCDGRLLHLVIWKLPTSF